MIRATTGGVLKSYRNNLMNSFISMNKARDTVLTQRNFNSYAEDPAAAAKAFKLRKSRMAVESQYNICNDAYSKYQTAFSCLQTVDKLIDTENGSEQMNTLKNTTLEMLNDPKGDARTQLTKVLDQLSETIVQTMNQKYGDNFIFAGADGHNVPFEVKDNKLYYRGVPVDAAVPDVITDDTGAKVTAADGSYVLSSTKTISQDAYDAAIADGAAAADYIAYTTKDDTGATVNRYILAADAETMTPDEYDTAVEDAAKLKYLVNEKAFVDIGLGFQENENGQLIESSAFDSALNGLTFLGYGVDADGDPKNIYSLVQKMRELAESVPDGEVWDPIYEEFRGLVTKLEQASSNYKTEFTNMDASTTKLKNNLDLLQDNFYNLQEQYSNLEDVDMVDAITSFIWAQYCYNAALKVGNNVLSESLMDYLN